VLSAVLARLLPFLARVDAANLIETLDELEAGGLIRREPDPDDRRRRRIDLTPAGRNRHVAWLPLARAGLALRLVGPSHPARRRADAGSAGDRERALSRR
jgi:DNA-binding MarR family transcriptional regulator